MDITSRSLYIENFPLDTSETTLRSLLDKFGKIKRLDVPKFPPEHPLCRGLTEPKSKGYAFVEYCSKVEADKAFVFFNDLNTILRDASHDSKGQESQSNDVNGDTLDDPQFKRLRLLRVMQKQTYLEFTKHYEEQRFQSLVRAAKTLVV